MSERALIKFSAMISGKKLRGWRRKKKKFSFSSLGQDENEARKGEKFIRNQLRLVTSNFRNLCQALKL